MAKLVGRRSLARSLALLARGWTVEQAAQELRKRYHPSTSLEEVQKAYFPKRPILIAQQQGKPRSEIVQTLEKLKANAKRARERMTRLHSDPKFAAANAQRARERMTQLHSDPKFAAANAQRSREKMTRLHSDPKFAAAHAERMKQLNSDPKFAAANAQRSREKMTRLHSDSVFRVKMLAGLVKFWNAYRAAKQGALEEMFRIQRFGKRGWKIPVEPNTPETLAYANQQHRAISKALLQLPLLHQAVVAAHFDLDHPVPQKHVERAKALQPKQRENVLQQALTQLRQNPTLKKHAQDT